MGECTRAGFCNFMHLKPISRDLRRELYSRMRGDGVPKRKSRKEAKESKDAKEAKEGNKENQKATPPHPESKLNAAKKAVIS